jgi:hypothetical protein
MKKYANKTSHRKDTVKNKYNNKRSTIGRLKNIGA